MSLEPGHYHLSLKSKSSPEELKKTWVTVTTKPVHSVSFEDSVYTIKGTLNLKQKIKTETTKVYAILTPKEKTPTGKTQTAEINFQENAHTGTGTFDFQVRSPGVYGAEIKFETDDLQSHHILSCFIKQFKDHKINIQSDANDVAFGQEIYDMVIHSNADTQVEIVNVETKSVEEKLKVKTGQNHVCVNKGKYRIDIRECEYTQREVRWDSEEPGEAELGIEKKLANVTVFISQVLYNTYMHT